MKRMMSLTIGLAFMAAVPSIGLAQTRSMQTTKTATTMPQGSVGAQIGVLDVDKISGAVLGLGAYGEYVLDPNVLVGGSLNHWSAARNDTDLDLTVSDLVLGAHAKFILTDAMNVFKPFGMAGLDLHRLSVKVDDENIVSDPRTDDLQNDETRFGVNGAVGTSYALNTQLDASAMLQYRHIFGGEDVKFNQLAFVGGVAYWM